MDEADRLALRRHAQWYGHLLARRIKDKGGLPAQFCSVIDIMPTILEAVGVPAPASINGVVQKPIEGTSLVYSFDDAKVPSKHTTQYFEMFGNRAIYHDGWIAATTPGVAPWDTAAEVQGRLPAVLDYKWELYKISDDFSEAIDLAAEEPAKLKELQDLFWTEAEKYNVLPLENGRIDRFDVNNRPSLTTGRDEFTYYPGLVRIPEGAAPDVKNKSYQIKAEVVIPESGAEGMLLTHGGRFAGYGLYVLKGKPVFCYNLAGVVRYFVTGKENLSPGATPSFTTSSMTALASAKAVSVQSRWMAKQWPLAASNARWHTAFRSTRRSTAVKTPARQSAKITRCPSSLPANSRRLR